MLFHKKNVNVSAMFFLLYLNISVLQTGSKLGLVIVSLLCTPESFFNLKISVSSHVDATETRHINCYCGVGRSDTRAEHHPLVLRRRSRYKTKTHLV